MTDSIDENAIRFVTSSDYESVAVPDEMYYSVSKNKKSIVPYVALTLDELAVCELVVVHKGMMHRIGFQGLSAISFGFQAVYADEVYVCFARAKKRFADPSVVHDDSVPAFMQHVHSVREYMRTERFDRPSIHKLRCAVLVSAFGVGNIGDDLVSYAAKRMLEDAGIAEVVMSGPSVSYDAIYAADIVAVGGGGLFYDSDIVNTANYLYPIQEATRQGKPSAVLGVGVQGIRTELGKRVYSRHLESATFLSVRDPMDKQELVAINPSLGRTIAGADMAFYLTKDLRRIAQPVRTAAPLALFSLSSILDKRLLRSGYELKAVALDVIGQLTRSGHEVKLVLHSEDDREFFEWIARAQHLDLIELAGYGLPAAARLYASASLVVTSRFHALILGVIFEKRVVSVYSETGKTGKLISSYLPSIAENCQSIDSFDGEALLRKLARAVVADPEEVERCVAMTYVMAAELAKTVQTAR